MKTACLLLIAIIVTINPAWAELLGKGDKIDVSFKTGVQGSTAKIMDVSSDSLLVIDASGVDTIKRAALPPEIAKLVNWPAPAPKAPTVATKALVETNADTNLKAIFGNQEETPAPVKIEPAPEPKIKAIPLPAQDTSPLTQFTGEVNGTLLATHIFGQCFIATKGGTNYKLGAVKVRIYPKDFYRFYTHQITLRQLSYGEKMAPIIKAAQDSSDYSKALDLLKMVGSYNDSLTALMPSSPESIYTDADGKFDISHKVAKPYVVVANAERTVGDDVEKYEWCVDSSDIPDSGQVMLSNQNLK